MRRPNLNLNNQKNAELYIAVDTVKDMFAKANILSPLTYDRLSLSYHSMKRDLRESKREEFSRVINAVLGDKMDRWNEYQCDIHFKKSGMGEVVLVDAGIFTVVIFIDKNDKFRIKYSE
ncbi:hypothetical protein SAMN02910369_02062 [Lachnospiraceae bacterium NE2001]|nr:hypothetical protein SAMN02910369_02062 [Lachnospiraceae bacterium NE2001]